MRLDQAVFKKGLCNSRTEAQEMIVKGFVFVNGNVCTKQTRQIIEDDELHITSRRKFVSRGGEKLEGAFIQVFGDGSTICNFLKGKVAIDIGASTGGFTDYLLSCDIAKVDSVDVGTSQLNEKIRNDKRVSVFENTDIRVFKNEKTYDVIVADLSFISLTNVFDKIISLGKKNAVFFLLIKPQFEVGKGNTKKGIVKDKPLVKEVLFMYKNIAVEKGMKKVEIFPCSITGGDGNQEYFLYGIL